MVFAKSLKEIFKGQSDIQTELQLKRKMSGEKASAESKRFVPNKSLLLDCSWPDAHRYRKISSLYVADIPSFWRKFWNPPVLIDVV